ncbi:MAG: hypothetical protein WCD31_10835 [Gillisia sp.]
MKQKKEFLNRIKLSFKIICYSGIVIFFGSCNNDDVSTTPDCGCESETLVTNPETANLSGKLFYKNDSSGNNFNNKKYWIVYIEDNCANCIHSLIVCNENILDSIPNIPTFTNINDIIGSANELNKAIDIKFSGELKTICNPIFAPADYTYNNITLISIEQQ